MQSKLQALDQCPMGLRPLLPVIRRDGADTAHADIGCVWKMLPMRTHRLTEYRRIRPVRFAAATQATPFVACVLHAVLMRESVIAQHPTGTIGHLPMYSDGSMLGANRPSEAPYK